MLDTPGPPINFVFEDIRKSSVLCKWEPPLDDGGSEIINYTLEKKDKTKPDADWIVITSTLRQCKYSVTKLIEGKEYLFRVRAENRFGPGPPCVSKPFVAKDPFGKVPLSLSLPFYHILWYIIITVYKIEFLCYSKKFKCVLF
jgi:titin